MTLQTAIASTVFVSVASWVSVASAEPRQTDQDEYTRYELLAPDSASFAIDYEVTATTAGATYFFNPIRKGSVASHESVYDMMSGRPLEFAEVSGAEAKASGLAGADPDTDYLRIHLARPVPPDGGQARIRIIKTYRDPKSYYREGDAIVFNRPLGIRRNSVVLPAGYRLIDCNVPSQVLSEPDGRVRISFMHQDPGPAALVVRAKPGALAGPAAAPRPPGDARSWEPPPARGPTERARLSDRAHQDRDIVYFLQEPSTHAFSLHHDYTESREGADHYVNVVRAGSTVSSPSAKILDTGEALADQIMTGAGLRAAKIDTHGERVPDAAQVVVVRFPPVGKGRSIRLRISETYTAPASYRLEGDELVFDRSFGRPRNAVVLPDGWYLTWLSIPGVVSQTGDGLTRIDFVNGRPDSIDVLIKARRTAAGAAEIGLTVEFLADGRCSVNAAGPGFHAGMAYLPSPAAPMASGRRCVVPSAPRGVPVRLTVRLPSGAARPDDEFPRVSWREQDGRWIGTASLPAAPAFVSVSGPGAAAPARWLDGFAPPAAGAAFGANFYGWFLFSAAFIAAYFAWARAMGRRDARRRRP